MKTDRLQELSAQVVRLEAEIDAIKTTAKAESRQMTDEERTKWGELNKQYKAAIEEKRLEAEDLENRSFADKAVGAATKPQFTEDDLQRKYPGLPSREMRYANLGQFVQDVIDAHPSRNGRFTPRLQESIRAASGMGIVQPADGGFAIQPNISARIIEPLFAKGGDLVLGRLNQTNITTGNDMSFVAIDETTQSGSVWGGVTVYWLSEADARTPSTAKLRKVELKLKDVAGLMYLTNDLMKDAPALSQRLENGFRIALRNELVRCVIRGTGAGQPLGFLNSAGKISILAETGQLAATIVMENLLNMRERITPGSNAVWLYNPTCFKQLFTTQVGLGTSGALVSGMSLQSAGIQSILGYPAIECPWCSVLGTVGDIVLVDLAQYEFIHQGGEEIAYSAHVRFLYDEMAMRVIYRCDGRMSAISTTTSPDGTTTVAPVITLATRS